MKRNIVVLCIFLCICIACGQAENKKIIKRIDLGISAGPVFFSAITGYSGILETRLYFGNTDSSLNPFAGMGGYFEYTEIPENTIRQGALYAIAGTDYLLMKKNETHDSSFCLRGQIGCGVTYTSDTNGEGSKLAKFGYVIHPAAGVDYGFKRMHLSLMGGYQVIGIGSATATALTASLGFGYSI